MVECRSDDTISGEKLPHLSDSVFPRLFLLRNVVREYVLRALVLVTFAISWEKSPPETVPGESIPRLRTLRVIGKGWRTNQPDPIAQSLSPGRWSSHSFWKSSAIQRGSPKPRAATPHCMYRGFRPVKLGWHLTPRMHTMDC